MREAVTGSQKQEQPRVEVGLSLTNELAAEESVTLDRSNWGFGLVV